MNRFNKAILFGLVAAIFGASNSNCIVVEKNFEVISNHTAGKKQSIQVGKTTTEIEALKLTTKAIKDALKDATADKKVTYTTAFEQTVKKTLAEFKDYNKSNIATLYACWLIKVKSYIKITAINAAHAIFGEEKLVNEAIINEFYKSHLLSIDFTQFATPCEKETQSRWGTCKKIGYGLLAAAVLAAGAAGGVMAFKGTPSVAQPELPVMQPAPVLIQQKPTDPAAKPEMCWLGQNSSLAYPEFPVAKFEMCHGEQKPIMHTVPAQPKLPVAQPEIGWLGQPYVSIDNTSFAELFPEAECPATVAQPATGWFEQVTNAFCKASGGYYCQSK